MRRFVTCSLFVIALLVGVPGASVADGDTDVRAKALDALRMRLDAKMREASLLESQGKADEALAALREVGDIYDREMKRIAGMFVRNLLRPRVQPKLPGLSPRILQALAPDAKAVNAALERAVTWLVAHQSPNGGWEAATFMNWCHGERRKGDASKAPDGAGKMTYDVGVTGLATLALLASGAEPGQETPAGTSAKKAIHYLMSTQDLEGCLGKRSTQQYVYNHAIALLALVEAYARTTDALLMPAVQQGLDFSGLARNPYFGWRYGIKPGDNDTSVTSWMLAGLQRAREVNAQAVREGQKAPFQFDAAVFDGARSWLEKVTDPDYGKVGYLTRGSGSARPQEMLDRFPSEHSEAMTSAAILMRSWMGQTLENTPAMRRGAELVVRTAPRWNEYRGTIDMYAWYMGTEALAGLGGRYWTIWRNSLAAALLPNQRTGDACDAGGSWDPAGPWGEDGGRVYATAICALMLSHCKGD